MSQLKKEAIDVEHAENAEEVGVMLLSTMVSMTSAVEVETLRDVHGVDNQ